MNKKLDASEIYLREDEYLQVDISGLRSLRKCPDAWRALCAYWASPSFVKKSRMKRANRQVGPRVTQRYGAYAYLHLARQMVAVYYFNLIIIYLFAISQFLLWQEAQSGGASVGTYGQGYLLLGCPDP
jgi:hypothetical protein